MKKKIKILNAINIINFFLFLISNIKYKSKDKRNMIRGIRFPEKIIPTKKIRKRIAMIKLFLILFFAEKKAGIKNNEKIENLCI